MKNIRLLLSITVFLLATKSFALISPTEMLRQELLFSVGANPCVKVLPTSGDSTLVTLVTCSDEVGQALAFLLKSKNVRIENTAGQVLESVAVTEKTKEFVRKQLQVALAENRYLSRVIIFNSRLIVELKPLAIQYHIDNISVPYHHATYLAETLFQNVLKELPLDGISVKTSSSKVTTP